MRLKTQSDENAKTRNWSAQTGQGCCRKYDGQNDAQCPNSGHSLPAREAHREAHWEYLPLGRNTGAAYVRMVATGWLLRRIFSWSGRNSRRYCTGRDLDVLSSTIAPAGCRLRPFRRVRDTDVSHGTAADRFCERTPDFLAARLPSRHGNRSNLKRYPGRKTTLRTERRKDLPT